MRQNAITEQAGSSTAVSGSALHDPSIPEPLLLAIDASSPLAGLVISRGERLLASLTLGSGKPHSQVLFPAIQTIAALASVDLASIDLFAAVAGPGGFTGLRVGLSVIAGLAAGYGKAAASLSTLDLIALHDGSLGMRLITINAGRGELYCGLRENLDSTATRTLGADTLRSIADLPAYSRELKKERDVMWIHDPGDLKLSWSEPDHPDLIFRREQSSLAVVLARLAAAGFKAGSLTPLAPYYLRRPDAELKRLI